METNPIVLSEEEVRKRLRMEDLIPAMTDALRDLSAGAVVQPLRTVLEVSAHAGFLGVMPASGRALGAKLVTFYPQNQEVPTHHAMILLFRPETGEPLAIMDGRLITEMRTAAVSALATSLLARTDTKKLTILGSGVQARSHLEAMQLVRSFTKIKVWSPRNAERFAREFNIEVARSAEEAVTGADVIVVATAATIPVLRGGCVAPGAHINAVGATRPNWRELDDEVLRRSTIYVESREPALNESGDVIAAGKELIELGEVIAGKKPGRTGADQITLFKSVGVAAEDIAAAELALKAHS
jgi:ornithine cyclodeaminase/alanine dehydrogenase-like protein (mu-crystallin family)